MGSAIRREKKKQDNEVQLFKLKETTEEKMEGKSEVDGFVKQTEVEEIVRKVISRFYLGDRDATKKEIREEMDENHRVVESRVNERYKKFFYLLLRDKLTVGEINKLVGTALEGEEITYFSDEILSIKASSLVNMFVTGEYVVKEIDAQYQWPKDA